MARARRIARRRNATLLINPSPKRRRVVRRRRANTGAARSPRRRVMRRRVARRNPAPRRRSIRRTRRARRSNPAPVRRRRARRAARRNPAPGRRRIVRRRRARNPGRRRAMRRRSNPGLMGMFKRIPLIGGLLGSAFGFLPFAAFGALGTEPILWAASGIGRFLPGIPTSLLYALSGTAIAAAVASFLPGVSPETRKKLAIAVASAGGGIAYYKWRTGEDTDAATEIGALELHPFGRLELGAVPHAPGMGDAWETVPLSAASASYGAVTYGR